MPRPWSTWPAMLVSVLLLEACSPEGAPSDQDGAFARSQYGVEGSCCDDDEPCQDGFWCNGRETCNCWGDCEPGPPVNCDDGDPCTRDTCSEEVPGDNAGRCIRGRLSRPGCGCARDSDCDDGLPCTTDTCNAPTGECRNVSAAAGTPCDDGRFCTAGDACDGRGACIGGSGSPCTLALGCPNGICDDATRACTCTIVWTDETHWLSGTSSGVSTSPSFPLHPDCADPGTICLDSSATTSRYIWVPNTDSHTIAKINVDTGVMEPGFPIPTLGRYPSRTAADLRDGSVWVGNRASDGSDDGARSNVVHFAADGSVICRVPLPGRVRAVAIDRDYNIWAGVYWAQEIVKISGAAVDPGVPYPVCRILGRWPAGGNPYGAIGDGFGNVWFVLNYDWRTSFDPSVQSLLRVPIINPAGRQRLVPSRAEAGGCFNTYGIGVDSEGRVWVPGKSCNRVFRYDPAGGTWRMLSLGRAYQAPRGVTIDGAGNAWVALGESNRLARIPPDMSGVTFVDLGVAGKEPVGTAVDHLGRIWAVAREADTACRVDVSGWPAYSVSCFTSGGRTPYAYSDITGLQHVLHTVPTGTWTSAYDSGDPTSRWSRIEWTADEVPGVTDVSVRARTAATRAALAGATWSGRYTNSPANILADPLVVNPNRWIEVEATLTTTDPRRTPVLYSLSVVWTR